tara:strand:- start:274 stop:816 length:543 start_codon:yes stop_codon:yes gene_type:complete
MYVRPGFFPGGHNDPAMGGTGHIPNMPRPAPGTQGPSIGGGFGGFPGSFGGFGGYGGMGGYGGFPGMPQFQPPGGGMNPWLGSAMGFGGGFSYPQPSFPNMPNPGNPGGGVGLIGGGAPQPPSATISPPAAQPYNPNVSAGRLAEAQRLAAAGKMGRAKQQWEKGGGTWDKRAHLFLKNG